MIEYTDLDIIPSGGLLLVGHLLKKSSLKNVLILARFRRTADASAKGLAARQKKSNNISVHLEISRLLVRTLNFGFHGDKISRLVFTVHVVHRVSACYTYYFQFIVLTGFGSDVPA